MQELPGKADSPWWRQHFNPLLKKRPRIDT